MPEIRELAEHYKQIATSPDYRKRFNSSFDNLLESALNRTNRHENDGRKIFVEMVGFTQSGKTEVVNELKKSLPIVPISSRDIHDVINDVFPHLKDDNSIDGSGYVSRQTITFDLRLRLTTDLVRRGMAIFNDSANLDRKTRKMGFLVPRLALYETGLIWVRCGNDEILRRIDLQPKDKDKQDLTDLYNKQQKDFQPPTNKEADIFLVFESGKDNVRENLISKLDYKR